MKLISRKDFCIMLVLLACSGMLFFVPSPETITTQQGITLRAKVLSVDNSGVSTHGLINYGNQMLTIQILSGAHKGKIFKANNELRAQMELDKEFKPGDKILAASTSRDPSPDDILNAQDHYRIGWSLALFAAFCLLLCLFGGWTGVNALLSFIFSCLVLWKGVIPLALSGYSPIWVSFTAVVFLTAVIMYLVARGINKRCITAFCGAVSGIMVGFLTAKLFTVLMNINGATLPYAQALYYSGYDFLNLQNVFVGAMILASSGAVMDLGMDISCGMEEVYLHNPALTRKQLIQSGLRMGRSVVGTMTTTLLLAYSGGYITLLMMFYAQGTSPLVFINNPLVASEAVKTLIGSFSLVLVAPFTALIGGIIYVRK